MDRRCGVLEDPQSSVLDSKTFKTFSFLKTLAKSPCQEVEPRLLAPFATRSLAKTGHDEGLVSHIVHHLCLLIAFGAWYWWDPGASCISGGSPQHQQPGCGRGARGFCVPQDHPGPSSERRRCRQGSNQYLRGEVHDAWRSR